MFWTRIKSIYRNINDKINYFQKSHTMKNVLIQLK